MSLFSKLRQKHARVLEKKLVEAKKTKEEEDRIRSLKRQIRETKGKTKSSGDFKKVVKGVGSGIFAIGKGAGNILGEMSDNYERNTKGKKKNKLF